jgi:NAD dependent epimerase/dehydratase
VSSLQGRRVLVTGADGFIGSHLTEALVRAGADVRALALYNSFNAKGWLDDAASDVRGHFEVMAGDIRDPYGMRAAVSGREVVFHLAALIAIPYSYQAPEAYVDTNIKGTLNLLQAARDLGVERFVQTSTSEVYGTAQFVPITEHHPTVGQSPYSATKIGSDQLALSYFCSFGLPVTILRPFNTYGPRQSLRAVLPNAIMQILAGNTVLHLGALHPTRDFTFVTDTATGFMQIATSDAALGEVVNIGSNFEIAIGDAVEMIAEVMGREVSVELDPTRLRPLKSEVERLYASTDKAKALFNWAPAHGKADGFRRGLDKTIAWFSKPENLAHYREQGYVV